MKHYVYYNEKTDAIVKCDIKPDGVSYTEVDKDIDVNDLVLEANKIVIKKKKLSSEEAYNIFISERNKRINAIQWRVQRWRDEKDLGFTRTTDDGIALLKYIQELRDLPDNLVDPENPIWPIEPRNE